MGTFCQSLAILYFNFYFINCETTSTTTSKTVTLSPTEDLLNKFLSAKDDFVNSQDNALYFPLNKSLSLKLGTEEDIPDMLESLLKQTETYIGGYRNYMLLNKSNPDVTKEEIIKFMPMKVDGAINSIKLSSEVSRYPTDLFSLHRIGDVMKAGSLSDKESFLEKLTVPALIRPELEFITGYRWMLAIVSEDLSMKTLINLPIDSVLSITKEVFKSQDMENKLMNKEFLVAPEISLSAWYALAQQNLGDSALTENFNAYDKLILSAPMDKMLENMKNLKASDKIKILKEHNLDSVKVQSIWDSLDADSLAVEDIDEQKIAEVFFSVGNKLDMAQIDNFYTKTFVHLYSKRHEVEELWVHNDKVDLPWPVLKYISKVHWPSVTTDKWGQKELIDLGAFGVGLSRDELEAIPASAFASLSTLEHFFSNRLTLGQLFVIFDKMNEGAKTAFNLPVYLYPCLHSSVLSGEETTGNMKIDMNVEQMIKASVKFTPAQKIAYFTNLQKEELWKKETVSLILLHNPSLLAEVSKQEFVANLDVIKEAVLFSGRNHFNKIVDAIRELPRRLLNAWLEATVLNDDTLDVDKLLDKSESHEDHFTRLQKSKSASSIALPGLCCHMIEMIPMDRLMEVISEYRFSMPGEVIPSDSRMCLVDAIRQYLRTKAAAVGSDLSSEIELLSLLSSADIRAIGAELLLCWGGEVLSNIPHPEVSYEVLLKLSEENPHLFFHNGVSFDDVTTLAKQMLETLKKKNEDNVDFAVLKKMRDLVPFLDSKVLASRQDIQQFFRLAYPSPLAKGICVPDAYRQRFRDLMIKGFGAASTWSAEDLVTLGDLMVVLTQTDLYSINHLALRKALPSLVKNSVYSTVFLPEVRGHVEPQLYYKACNEWLTSTNEENTFTPAWERLARWMVSGAHLVMSVQPTNPQPKFFSPDRKKRSVSEKEDVNVLAIYNKVNEEVMKRFPFMSKEKQSHVIEVLKKSKFQLVEEIKKIVGGDQNNLKELMSSVSDINKADLRLASEKTQIAVIQELVSYLELNAEKISINDVALNKVLAHGQFPHRLTSGVEIAGHILSRSKRDLSSVNFMSVHDKVMDILVERFNGLTLLEQEASKEIIQESQELIGNGTLTLLGLDPTTLSISQADVLSTIEKTKANGMTAEQEAGIVQIAKDAQARLIQELSELLALSADDLNLTEEQFEEIKALKTFEETEKFMVTAVYEFSTEAVVTEDSTSVSSTTSSTSTTTSSTTTTTTTTQSIIDIVETEEVLVHSISKISELSDLTITCDIIKTAGKVASMLTKSDIDGMNAQDVVDCMETFGNLDYTSEKLNELWPAIKSKLDFDSNMLSEGEMVLMKNLLPAIAVNDLDMLDITEANIDGVSVLGQVIKEVSTYDLMPVVAKYVESKDGDLTQFELQTLGRLLCGLSEHSWHRIPKEIFLSVLPQILPLNCHVDGTKVVADLMKKVTIEDKVGNAADLNWLAPFVYSSNLSAMNFYELTGAGARNLGDLSSYSAEMLMSLNPQAASLVQTASINKLDNVDKLTALARSTGEGPKMRKLLTSKLTNYPPAALTRKEIKQAILEAQRQKRSDGNSADKPVTAGIILLVCVLFSLNL